VRTGTYFVTKKAKKMRYPKKDSFKTPAMKNSLVIVHQLSAKDNIGNFPSLNTQELYKTLMT